MGTPMIKVPLRVELRRVAKAASGQPGKVHVIVNGTLLCEPITDSEAWTKRTTEQVGPATFAGRSACIICYASLSGITVDEAKAQLAEADEAAVVAKAPDTRPALWVNMNEVWPSGEHELHYILRGTSGWERHKVVHDVEARKHYDPRLFEKLTTYLNAAE